LIDLPTLLTMKTLVDDNTVSQPYIIGIKERFQIYSISGNVYLLSSKKLITCFILSNIITIKYHGQSNKKTFRV